MDKASLSIVIPALNEEHYLPLLLDSIKQQNIKPKEIIVSDAFSTDNTRKIAHHYGCKIVDGAAHPSGARNNGAKAATGDIILFLDADVTLPPDFLEKNLAEFEYRNLDEASCFPAPKSPNLGDHIGAILVNSYFNLIHPIRPHANGFCIFARKSLHDQIGGFDESLKLTEDHDYANRASKVGKTGFLKSVDIPMSIRRYEEEGKFSTILKYSLIELHWIFMGKITTNFLAFDFGKHYKK